MMAPRPSAVERPAARDSQRTGAGEPRPAGLPRRGRARIAGAMSAKHRYHPYVLSELARWGIVPHAGTDPSRAYFLLKCIYTFEIREMKIRRKEAERLLGPQPLDDYRQGLEQLKEKYAVLKTPARKWAQRWVEGGE